MRADVGPVVQDRPSGGHGPVAIDAEGGPQRPSPLLQLGPVPRRRQRGNHILRRAVQAVEAHHVDQLGALGRRHGSAREVHGPRLVRRQQSPGLRVLYRDEVFAVAPELVCLGVLAGPLVEDVVVRMVSLVAVGSDSPDGVLQAHGRFHMRRRVEAFEVPAGVDEGYVVVLPLKVILVSNAPLFLSMLELHPSTEVAQVGHV